MTQAANLGALGTNVSSSGIAQAAGGGTAGTAGVTGFKNRLINGDFSIWQRGTSSSSAGYLADRWQLENTGTYAQSSDVPSGQGFPYSCTVSVTSGTAYGVIKQKIEAANCTDLVGKSVTVSFWVKNLTGDPAMYAILYYANSTDNFGSVTAISTQAFTSVLNTWTKITLNWNSLPAGVANGVQIYVFSADASVAPSYRFTGAQLELGTAATNFDFLSFGTELMLCQRYFSTSFPYGTAPVQNSGLYTWVVTLLTSGYGMYSQHRYPVPMRITATTITGYNGGAANNLVRNVPAGVDITNLGINPTSTTGFNIVCYGGAGDAGLPPVGWNWAASAEL
jgi:hypothetical protein